MLIHVTKKEMQVIKEELLLHKKSGGKLEVEVNPDDKKLKEPLIYRATTLLHLAAKYGNAEATQYLIDSGYDVNVTNPSGCTPIMIAVYFSQWEIMLMLIDANADIFLCDSSGMSAAKLALRGCFVLIMLTKIKTICGDDSQATAKKLLEIDCSLSAAALLKDSSIVSYMLDHGREVDEADRYVSNCTALQYAVRYADLKTVNLLLDRGADVNLADDHGQTPLFFYDTESEDTNEKIEVLRTLINRGASLTLEDPRLGCPAVEHLLKMGKRQTVRTLLPYVGDITRKTQNGLPLLHILMINSNPGVVEECRDKDWNFHVLDVTKRTAIWLASNYGNVEAVEFLLSKGVDPDGVNFQGINVLMGLSVFTTEEQRKNKNRLKCAELLLRHGANLQHMCYNRKKDQIDTIFDCILESRDFELSKIILAHLAYMQEFGVTMTKICRIRMNENVKFPRYLQLCKRWFDKMKKIVICDELTLYEFFMENEENMRIRARNPKFVSGLERIIHSQRDSTMYYSNMLRERFKTVKRILELKEIIVLFVSENYELSDDDCLIEKIMEFMI